MPVTMVYLGALGSVLMEMHDLVSNWSHSKGHV